MNRIRTLTRPDNADAADLAISASAATYSPAASDRQQALFVPLHYEAGYRYPLIVWLHGQGGDESQLRRVMPHISTRNQVGVAPRAPRRDDSGLHVWPDMNDDLSEAEESVTAAIAAATARCAIAQDRVFLVGADAGGTTALRIALANPSRFAGAASLGGPFPTTGMPLRHLNEVRQLPLLITTGRESTSYPTEQIQREVRLFFSAGLHVTFRLYPGGDEISTQLLADVDRWIMQHVTGEPTMSPSTYDGNASYERDR